MIGIDIVDVDKFTSKKMVSKVFTDEEMAYAKSKANSDITLAGIYAAKEAVIKAFDLKLTDILRQNIEIKHQKNRPVLYLYGNIQDADISISHNGSYAIGVCYKNSVDLTDINEEIARLLPARVANSHKDDYGKIAVLGGSRGMAGSVYMASLAAMKTGAGLTYIIAPKSIGTILQIKANEQIINEIKSDNFYYSDTILEEVLDHIKDKDVLAIGPGMGRAENLDKLIAKIIKNSNLDIVIDADGLNAVSKNPAMLKSSNNIILTPHMMEFARLTGLTIDEINENQEKIARDFALKYNITLVLKSHNTLVTDGSSLYINKIGNPGMATAGSGDVLTGVISTLLKRIPPFDAARLGVYIHSLAGDLASFKLGEDSIIATDIINEIPEAIKKIREIQCRLM